MQNVIFGKNHFLDTAKSAATSVLYIIIAKKPMGDEAVLANSTLATTELLMH